MPFIVACKTAAGVRTKTKQIMSNTIDLEAASAASVCLSAEHQERIYDAAH